jgi:hypothetical protein
VICIKVVCAAFVHSTARYAIHVVGCDAGIIFRYIDSFIGTAVRISDLAHSLNFDSFADI